MQDIKTKARQRRQQEVTAVMEIGVKRLHGSRDIEEVFRQS